MSMQASTVNGMKLKKLIIPEFPGWHLDAITKFSGCGRVGQSIATKKRIVITRPPEQPTNEYTFSYKDAQTGETKKRRAHVRE